MEGGQECYFVLSGGQLEPRTGQRHWLNIHQRKISRLLNLHQDDVFVDIGCGEGYHTLPLAARAGQSFGFDFVESALAVIRIQAHYDPQRLLPVIASGDGIPLPDGRADKLLCNHVLEHVVDDRGVVREIKRVLRPGGLALIGVPLAFSPQVRLLIRLRRLLLPKSRILQLESVRAGHLVPDLIGRQGHIRFYSLRSVNELLERGGFEVVKAEGIGLSLRGRPRDLVRRNRLLLEFATGLGYPFPAIGDGVLILSRKI